MDDTLASLITDVMDEIRTGADTGVDSVLVQLLARDHDRRDGFGEREYRTELIHEHRPELVSTWLSESDVQEIVDVIAAELTTAVGLPRRRLLGLLTSPDHPYAVPVILRELDRMRGEDDPIGNDVSMLLDSASNATPHDPELVRRAREWMDRGGVIADSAEYVLERAEATD